MELKLLDRWRTFQYVKFTKLRVVTLCAFKYIQAERKLEKDRAKAKKKSEQSWSSWAGSWFYGETEEDTELSVTKVLSGETMRKVWWMDGGCVY